MPNIESGPISSEAIIEPTAVDYVKARGALIISERMPLQIEGHANFLRIYDHFRNGKPVIGIANHTSMLDALIMIRAFQHIAGRQMAEIGFPASEKLFDGRMRGEGKVMKAMERLRLGLHFYRMVQSRDPNKKPGLATDLKNSRAFKKLREVLKRSRPEANNFVGYYTEGGRSPDGNLQMGEPGISLLFRNGLEEETLIVPFGFIGLKDIYDDKLHVDKIIAGTSKVIVGEAFTSADTQNMVRQYEIDEEHTYMLKIAQLLPNKMWGWYNQYHFHSILDDMKRAIGTPKTARI